jgi:hypothetical protein
MKVAEISVTVDAGQVVMTFNDYGYDEPFRFRVSPDEARQLSAALAEAVNSEHPR